VARNETRIRRMLGWALISLLAGPQFAGAQRLKPIPHPVGQPQATRPAQPQAQASASGSAGTSSWTPLTNQPTFLVDGAANPILLTDGTVLVQDAGFPDWWRLTPDQNGSYINGTWTQVASLPPGYSPLYHSSAVLPDGRLIIEGGEYICDPATFACNAVWTNLGAIYDPVANAWTSVNPPAGWLNIGDAQSVVLPNGTYMQANCCTTQQALLDAKTLTWMQTGANKFDINDEEGWTLLPNGEVLTVDAYVPAGIPYEPLGTNSEIYNPEAGSWLSAGSTIVQLWDSGHGCGGMKHASFELGPGILRPDGTVFYTGANSCGTGHTAIFNSQEGTWAAGPDFPNGLDIADGPASLLPSGNVLVDASPGIFNSPTFFFEFDGSKLNPVAGPPNAPGDSSFFGNMLVLPTGQVLLTDFSDDIEIYSASGTANPAWAPTIKSAPASVNRGGSYVSSGTLFNGVSQGAAYGDDAQAATNFPLVRITNRATGHVFYSRTHDPSSMAVANSGLVSTQFDVPADQERGISDLEVVANGVPSPAVRVKVQ
jgi:hypothetical protein